MKKTKNKEWFRIVNNAATGVADIYIYDEISQWWGDNAKSIHEQISAMVDVQKVNVYINSPGGDVHEGIAIYNQLKRLNATVSVYVDGVAASIASVIAMAASPGRRFMGENTSIMIHNPSTGQWGGIEDMERAIERLKNAKESMITTYESATGLDRDEIVAMMDAETWMTASEAKEKGFCDEITAAVDMAACADFDMSGYSNVPSNLVNLTKVDGSAEDNSAENKGENKKQKGKLMNIFAKLFGKPQEGEDDKAYAARAERLVDAFGDDREFILAQLEAGHDVNDAIKALKADQETLVNDLKQQIQDKDEKVKELEGEKESLEAKVTDLEARPPVAVDGSDSDLDQDGADKVNAEMTSAKAAFRKAKGIK